MNKLESSVIDTCYTRANTSCTFTSVILFITTFTTSFECQINKSITISTSVIILRPCHLLSSNHLKI